MRVPGTLITRNYANFRGVDFTDKEVSLYRSPDSLNMWKNYRELGKSIETRPDIVLSTPFDNSVFGFFFYDVGLNHYIVVHSGTYLYKVQEDGSAITKTSNLKKVYIKKDNFTLDNSLENDTEFRWQYVNGLTWCDQLSIISSIINDEHYLYVVRYNFDNSQPADKKNRYWLYECFKSTNGTDFEYIGIEDVPDDIKVGKLLENYGKQAIEFGNELIPDIMSENSLPNIIKTGNTVTQIYSGMNPQKSIMFVYNNILYILDGIHYLRYDGTTMSEVTGFIPTTTISMKPSGAGKPYQNVNLLNPIRINSFVADGESTEYVLDTQNLDTSYQPIVKINGTPTTDFTTNFTNGKITFTQAPPISDTDGKDNVTIQFSKTISGYADRIRKCTKAIEFDNRIFFTGNPDYPTTLFHSELYDPTYVDDQNYYTEGNDTTPIKGMVAGNNALWVFKEPNQENTTIYYHVPTTYINDLGEEEKAYITTHSSISTGCVADAINFGDDICFFSPKGMEAITQNITTEQVTTHRSGLVDSKLLNEPSYKNTVLAEWEGYLLVCCDNHIYLADSNQNYSEHARYEWFYWELSKDVKSVLVKDNILYIGTTDGIYSLTDTSNTRNVSSHWCTPFDEFNYPQYLKTTNKKGFITDCSGVEVTISVKTDNNAFEVLQNHTNVSLYTATRIKKKKWKGIQIKVSSTKPVELFSSTLEAYVGGYIKR